MLRVLVVGSCGKKKLYNDNEQPACHDINTHRDISFWKKKLPGSCAPARDMYVGPQNTELVKAVDLLRTIANVEVQFFIISAGFGMLAEQDLVPPYDCSFSTMPIVEVRKRSQEQNLQSSIQKIANSGFDLAYFALGKQYSAALGKDALSNIQIPTIVFHGEESGHLVRLPCSAQTVKTFSNRGHTIHGVVGFKGDLLRILVTHVLKKPNPDDEIVKWKSPRHIKKLVHRLGGLS
ncbi:MAG: DUF6884 domain-containing protein [Candidatus Thorarchaeota archaeon]|jgi:hypothetical protein